MDLKDIKNCLSNKHLQPLTSERISEIQTIEQTQRKRIWNHINLPTVILKNKIQITLKCKWNQI